MIVSFCLSFGLALLRWSMDWLASCLHRCPGTTLQTNRHCPDDGDGVDDDDDGDGSDEAAAGEATVDRCRAVEVGQPDDCQDGDWTLGGRKTDHNHASTNMNRVYLNFNSISQQIFPLSAAQKPCALT